MNNELLYQEFLKSRQAEKMTDEFAKILFAMTTDVSKTKKVTRWGMDSEDVVAHAMAILARTWNQFSIDFLKRNGENEENFPNRLYHFYYQTMISAPIQLYCRERRERDIKRDLESNE